jgi:hypothetical protein
MYLEVEELHATWHGKFTMHVHDPTIILEAIAEMKLSILHAYFEMFGSCNDINVFTACISFAC